MTPQEWIDEANKRWRWPHGEFGQIGAQHLAAALEEIAKRNYEITGHRDEIAFLHAKLSDAEEENARLQAQLAQAERVVVPEWDRDAFAARYPQGEWEEWEIRTAKEGYEFAASRAQGKEGAT